MGGGVGNGRNLSARRLAMVALSTVGLTCAAWGCGQNHDDIGADVKRLSSELTTELDSFADEDPSYASVRDVQCTGPEPNRFDCRAYNEVRPNFATFAEYSVRDCGDGIGWRALRTSGPSDFPAQVDHDESPAYPCEALGR
jgi:hypothetical protein